MTKLLEAPPAGEIIEVSLDRIELDHRNDRLKETADPEAIEALAASIEQVGLQQPIGVTTGSKPDRYRLVWGHRRVAAAKKAGLKSLRAVLRVYADDNEIQVARAVENIHRQDLNPVEEAIAVAALIDEVDDHHPEADEPAGFTASRRAQAIQSVAAKLGKSVTWVRDRAFLARLSEKARRLVLQGRLPLAHAREISKLADPNLADQIAGRMAAQDDEDQPQPIEEVRFEVSKSLFSLAQVPWRMDAAFADAPACGNCPHNSVNNPGLFEHASMFSSDLRSGMGGTKKEPEAGVCLQHSCYRRKTHSAKAAVRSAADKAIRKAETKKGKPAVNAAAIAAATPSYIKSATVAGQVKKKLEAPARPATKRRATYHDDWNSPKNQAKRDFEDAVKERDDEIIDKLVVPAINKIPGAGVMLELITRLSAFDQCRTSGKNKVPARARITGVLKLLAKPSWDELLKLEKEARLEVSTWEWRSAELVEQLAEAVGIKELPPMPRLEDFNAKHGVGADKPAKSPSGKKKAKKGGAS